MRVLFDTNVVLDFLLAREPHVDTAERLVNMVDTGVIEGVICATTVTTIHYLASKAVGATVAGDYVRELLSLFDVAAVDLSTLRGALDRGFADYEDAVLHEAARRSGAVAIVSRDASGFKRASLPVFVPVELLAAIGADTP